MGAFLAAAGSSRDHERSPPRQMALRHFRWEVVGMAIYEILTFALDIVLAAAATVAIYLGFAGMVGQLYTVRCARCRHMTFSSVDRPRQSCPRCRHPLLLDPLHALLHRGSPTKAESANH